MIRTLIGMLALGIGQAALASAETGPVDPFLVRLTENNEVPLPGTEFYPCPSSGILRQKAA